MLFIHSSLGGQVHIDTQINMQNAMSVSMGTQCPMSAHSVSSGNSGAIWSPFSAAALVGPSDPSLATPHIVTPEMSMDLLAGPPSGATPTATPQV